MKLSLKSKFTSTRHTLYTSLHCELHRHMKHKFAIAIAKATEITDLIGDLAWFLK
jgi:hypothetical protein